LDLRPPYPRIDPAVDQLAKVHAKVVFDVDGFIDTKREPWVTGLVVKELTRR
jgi:hypothetical protein